MGLSGSASNAGPHSLMPSLKRFPSLSPRSASARHAGYRRTSTAQVEIGYLETERKKLQRVVSRYRDRNPPVSSSNNLNGDITPSENRFSSDSTKKTKESQNSSRSGTRQNLMRHLGAMRKEAMPSPGRPLTISDLDVTENMIMLEKIIECIRNLKKGDRATANINRVEVFCNYGKNCLKNTSKLVRTAGKTSFYRWHREAIVSALHDYASVLDEPVDLDPLPTRPRGQPPTPTMSKSPNAAMQDVNVAVAVVERASQPGKAMPKTTPKPSPIVKGFLCDIRSRVQALDTQQNRLRAAIIIQTCYRGWTCRLRWPAHRCRLQICLQSEMSITLICFQAALWYRISISSFSAIRDEHERYLIDRQIRFEMGRRLHSFMACYFAEQPEPVRIAVIDKAMALADQHQDDLRFNETRRRRLDRWCLDPVVIARRKRVLTATYESLNRAGAPRPKKLWHRLIWAYWRLRAELNMTLRHAFIKQAVIGKTMGDKLWSDPWLLEYAQHRNR